MSCEQMTPALATLALSLALVLACGGGQSSAPRSDSAPVPESPGREAGVTKLPPSEPSAESGRPGTRLPANSGSPAKAPEATTGPATPAPVPISGKPSPPEEPASAPSRTPERVQVADPGGVVEVAAGKEGLERIGVDKCKVCHKVQFASWVDSAHARRDPQLDCEGCHGPGSEYKGMSVMKDPDRATAAGLVRPGRQFCTRCHLGEWNDGMLILAHAHKQ